jgi:hypothetical protein
MIIYLYNHIYLCVLSSGRRRRLRTLVHLCRLPRSLARSAESAREPTPSSRDQAAAVGHRRHGGQGRYQVRQQTRCGRRWRCGAGGAGAAAATPSFQAPTRAAPKAHAVVCPDGAVGE